MIPSPISVATRGRISPTTKKTLTLATIGWLIGLGLTPNPIYPDHRPPKDVQYGGKMNTVGLNTDSLEFIKYTDYLKVVEDEELILLIHSFLRTQ
jgi:hypothetical protein